ncbi:Peptidyl-prolyl cis-trans isomerase FKBP20-2, chloroplastic [Vitis vinifera]|uniref:peptidylprolyl isomerase n=1 Tax=Vitis vinifera TaxID=29760 RepID=A0A438HJ81_VITVI|nr:Peptidyl-prolyl cis-trans isomerase FKBP20-2, chloroplastic [Vitis vinifera]
MTIFSCMGREQKGCVLPYEENLRRRLLIFFLVSSGCFPTLSSSAKTKSKNPYDEKRLLQQNKRIQKENNAPEDFPNFVREGFEVKVVTPENYITSDSGLIYRDFEVGKGDCPKAGQQVTFHYVGYNESGRRIDSSYMQGSPAKIRMGTNALVPGFEEGIRDMKPGGKRRIIIPPELGPPVSLSNLCFHFSLPLSCAVPEPLVSVLCMRAGGLKFQESDWMVVEAHNPGWLNALYYPMLVVTAGMVGPSTFFSSKQFEVFDVELLNVKDCQRRTIGFYSDVVCE